MIDAIDGIVQWVRVLSAAAVEIVEWIVFGVVRCPAFGGGVSLNLKLIAFFTDLC